jgi:hypothetical protein
VGDEPPIHIESKITTARDRADAGHGAPGQWSSASRVVVGPGRWSRRVGAVALVGLLAGGLLWWAGDGEGDDGGAEAYCGIAGDRQRAARIAFFEAGHRLVQAGSFAYRGEVYAAEQASLRPGGWTAGEATVEGAVVLEVRLLTRDIAVDATGRAVETVTSGPRIWTRSASTVDGLGTAPWALRTLAGPTLRLLGTTTAAYVLSARDPREVAPDAAGRCVIRATMPAVDRQDPHADLSVGADLLVTLEEDGNIARIVVTSAPDDPELVLELDIMQIGEPQAIEPPDSGNAGLR